MKNLASSIKKSKTVGIIVSIILALCGILIFTTPVGSGIAFAWAMMVTMFTNGLFRVARYFMLPKENRNGWMLADGIISSVLGFIILAEIIAKPLGSTLGIISVMGFFIGFYEIITGINQLCSVGAVKQAGNSGGWMIFIGIVNILCGIFVASHPIISYFAMEWMIGFYLCVFGICTFIECLCMKSNK